ncbi:SEC14-like protein 2 [Trichonephila clavata]|uniref:SEC14-like protein 2 n=1 Tax=Trichonephila clavata TaxID=2740835 RepID=A0A8X6HAN5_TRICU|nr:SEC14-like protein 2 [Trichonephila clavata]
MTVPNDSELTQSEREAVEEMRRRLAKELPRKIYDENFLFYRFLKARDFDVDASEKMLRKTLQWRKENNVDRITTDYKFSEVFVPYFTNLLLGTDKEGCPVYYIPIGDYDVKGVHMAAKFPEMEKSVLLFIEEGEKFLEKQCKKLNKRVTGFVFIYDLDRLTFGNATHKKEGCKNVGTNRETEPQNINLVTIVAVSLVVGTETGIETLIKLLKMQQDNYPERIKSFYMINASSIFTIPFSILKAFLTARMLSKFRVYGTDGWKEDLLDLMDADQLPAFLGGKRTDPDGNPLCKTLVNQPCKVDEKYYMHKSINSLEKSPNVKKITLPRASFSEVIVDVEEAGSLIEWEFETKTRDIGFGLFYKEMDGDEERVVELVALRRLETDDFSETGMYKCEKVGEYVILFDNSYSWLRSKEVFYRINVVLPKEHENNVKN